MPTSSAPDAEADVTSNAGQIGVIFLCGFLAFSILAWMAEQFGASGNGVGLAIVTLSLAAYVLIAAYARTDSAREYFGAGRNMPASVNGMSVAAASLSIGGFVGLTGSLYALGYDGLAYVIGPLAGLVLTGVLIVPYLRKLGATTIPEFFGVRYGATARLLAVVFVALSLFLLLVAQFVGFAMVSARFLGVPYDWAIAIAFALLVTAATGGVRSVAGTQAVQYLVVLIAIVVPSSWLAFKTLGWPIPPLLFGEAVAQVTALETDLISKGLASADTLKPHAAAFLQLNPRMFGSIVFCTMLGVAVLPHLLAPHLTARTVRESRLSVAWASFFILVFAVTLPAYAAISKLHVYRLIDGRVSIEELPPWFESYSRADLVRIHGVSMHLVEDVAQAVKAGAGDASAVAATLKGSAPGSLAAFAKLKDGVKSVLVDVAKTEAEPQYWGAFRHTILPAAAKAANNKTGLLTEGSVWIEPATLPFLIPASAGMPAVVTGLVAAGALAAALACATGILVAVANTLAHDLYAGLIDKRAPDGRRMWVARGLLVSGAALAAALALAPPADLPTLAGWSFSLAASGLFPAIVLGIWSKRVNAWGAVAGMTAGFGLCLGYMMVTHFAPLTAQEWLAPVSSASDSELRKFSLLASAWNSAQGEAKIDALVALVAQARGSGLNPGVANAFGIPGSLAAVVAVPVGLLVAWVVSRITPGPRAETLAMIDEMRRPKGAEILPGSLAS